MADNARLSGAPDFRNGMNALLARNWWAVALRGVFALIFAALAVLLPGITLLSLVLLFAAYMLVDGVMAIVAGVRAAERHERWGLLLVEGIIDIAAGILAVLWPAASVLAFVLLLGAWAVVSGVTLASAAFRLHLAHGRWLMLLGGVVSIIWGILVVFFPFVGALVLTWWLAGYAVVFGITLLSLAFRLRRRHHERPPMGMSSAV